MTFDLATARNLLLTKTRQQVEIDTAYTWASRALACYQLYIDTHERAWLHDAEHYEHEAVEHAAFANDGCTTLSAVQSAIESVRMLATQSSTI